MAWLGGAQSQVIGDVTHEAHVGTRGSGGNSDARGGTTTTNCRVSAVTAGSSPGGACPPVGPAAQVTESAARPASQAKALRQGLTANVSLAKHTFFVSQSRSQPQVEWGGAAATQPSLSLTRRRSTNSKKKTR